MLSERKKKILAAIVEQYIKTGEPVGSKGLMGMLDFNVSSATIRNEMAELASLGYLDQPHTSAGRVPTQLGYRYYIDNLMARREIDKAEKDFMDNSINSVFGDPEKVIEQASEILADVTNCAAVSTSIANDKATIKKTELLPISEHTALIVLLTSTGVLKSRMCRSDFSIDGELTESFYSVVGKHFLGQPVADVDIAMLQTLAASLGEKTLSLTPFLITLADLAADAAQAEVMLEGQTNLLNHSKDYNTNVYELLNFLRKAEPLHRIVKSDENNLMVFIGKENMYKELENSSMIISKYSVSDTSGGAFGIIGPTRLDYGKVISSIEYISKLVGQWLSRTLEE